MSRSYRWVEDSTGRRAGHVIMLSDDTPGISDVIFKHDSKQRLEEAGKLWLKGASEENLRAYVRSPRRSPVVPPTPFGGAAA